MAYNKTNWKDTIKDASGNIIEKGTPLAAQHLNKMEDGIANATEKAEKAEGDLVKVSQQLADIDDRTKIRSPKGKVVLNGGVFENWRVFYGNAIEEDLENTLYSPQGVKFHIKEWDEMSVRNSVLRPFSLKYGKSVSVFLYIENARNLFQMELYFTPNLEYTQYVSRIINANELTDGWNEIILDYELFNVEGGYDFQDPIVGFQIRAMAGDSSEGVTITFDSVKTEREGKAKLIFTFDDGWLSQYTQAFPIMHSRGLVGNIGVVPEWVGRKVEANYEEIMSLGQLYEMHSYGWNLFNHTYSHPNLNNISTEEAIGQIVDCKNWLNDRGFTEASDMLAYPYGGHANIAGSQEFSAELTYARTLVEGLDNNLPNNPMRGKTRNMIKGVSPDVFKGYIDEAIRTGSVLVFCNHVIDNLEDDEYDMAYPIEHFTEIVDYVAEKKAEIDVITLSQWREYMRSHI